MLTSLSIRDIVLIDRFDLDLSAGLCVLTGETGAGKSILLDSLGLATGNRADKSLVRHGQSEGHATAVFDVPIGHVALARLNEADLMEEGETTVILRRAQRADGPSKAFINDRPVSVGLLQEIGGLLLEVHGQNDARGLLDARGHRALLDAFGRLDGKLLKTRGAFEAMEAAREALDTARAQIRQDAEDTDYLIHIIKELEELQPEEGEEDRLADERQRAMNAEKIADDLKAASDAMSRDGGLEVQAGAALKRLEHAAGQAGGALDAAMDALARVLDGAAEAEREVAAALSNLTFDEGELDQIEERLFALRAAARKHQVRVEQLPEVLENARARLKAVQSGESHVADLEAALKAATTAFEAAAADLRQARTKAAKTLDAAVQKELAPLKLDKAQFHTRLEDVPPGPHGIDRAVFEVATNPGAPFGPLTQVASGGEMSRFVLALKVALAEVGTAPTLIFDEIDQGVGGAVAGAIGERLDQLASTAGAQVIVVTHSPQIAAKGRTHFRVSKSAKQDQTLSRIEVLDDSARREEVARMLSAADITDEARAAADQLLGQSKGAGADRA